MNVRRLVPAALLLMSLALPSLAMAQAIPPVAPPQGGVGQVSPVAPPPPHKRHRAGWEQAVGLTPAQRQQIKPLNKALKGQKKQVHQQFVAQVEQSVLSPEQASQLQSEQANARANHEHFKFNKAVKALGLSPQQRQAMKSLRQQQKTAMASVHQQFFGQVQPLLSPDQQARLSQFLQTHPRAAS